MNSQVTFTSPYELKQKTLEKVKKNGITLKALLVYCMKDYIDGKLNFGLYYNSEPEIEEIAVNSKIKTKMKKIADLF
jgi:hypothetical protein